MNWFKNIAIIGIVGIFLVLPSGAVSAQKYSVHNNPVAVALLDGSRYWGNVPCHNDLHIIRTTYYPTGPVDAGPIQTGVEQENSTEIISAYTSFNTPEGENNESANPSFYTHCIITIIDSYNETIKEIIHSEEEEFQIFCDLITHELGHLFGHSDTGQTNTHLITYPLLGEDQPNYNSVPQCRFNPYYE